MLARDQRPGGYPHTRPPPRVPARLHDDVLVRIVQCRPDLVDLVVSVIAPDRADGGALAALDAGNCVQIAIECRPDRGFKPAVLRPERADVLDFGAHAHAAAALDALAMVSQQRRRRRVEPGPVFSPGRKSSGCPARPPATEARSLPAGRRSGTRRCAPTRAARPPSAALRTRVLVCTFMPSAAGIEHDAANACAFDLNDANAAGPDRLQALDIAERRNPHARLALPPPGSSCHRGPRQERC